MWYYAAAYACTGAVRNSSDQLAVLYFVEQLKLDIAKSAAAHWTMNLMPLVAVFGSLASGIISDKLFKGHRSPVAMGLYFGQSVVIIIAAVIIYSGFVGPTPMGVFLGLLFPGADFAHGQFHALAARHGGGDGHRRAQNGRLRFGRD